MAVIKDKSHARISPSGWKQWGTCAGSINLIASLNLPNRVSRYTAEGTVAHEIHEKCLKEGRDALYFKRKKFTADGFTFKVDTEMIEAVQVSLNYIRKRISDAEDNFLTVVMLVEKRVSLKPLGVDGLGGGTADVILIFFDEDTVVEVEVIDYKHGAGVAVYPDNNGQAMQYSLGVIYLPELNGQEIPGGILITISQPRCFSSRGEFPLSWRISKDELLNWEKDELVPKASATNDPNAPLTPDDEACRFCDASYDLSCPALSVLSDEAAMLDFESDGDVSKVTAEKKLWLYVNTSRIVKFLKKAEGALLAQMQEGCTDYNYHLKLVRMRSNRRFTEDAFDALGGTLIDHLEYDDMYEDRARGVTDIQRRLTEKLGKEMAAEIMAENTYKPEGGIAIAPLSDKRPAIDVSPESDFEDLADDDF